MNHVPSQRSTMKWLNSIPNTTHSFFPFPFNKMLLNCFSFHYTSNTPSHKTIIVQCILWSANIYTVLVKNNWIYFGGTILLTIKYISVFFKNNIHYIHTLVMVVDPLLFCVCKFYFIKCVAHTNSSMQSSHVCLHVIVLFQVPLIWFYNHVMLLQMFTTNYFLFIIACFTLQSLYW